MERVAVESKNIKEVGYLQAVQTLEIEFASGKVYQYYGVPAGVHDAMMRSESIGKYFDANIRKGGYAYKEIESQRPFLTDATT